MSAERCGLCFPFVYGATRVRWSEEADQKKQLPKITYKRCENDATSEELLGGCVLRHCAEHVGAIKFEKEVT